MGGGGKGGSQSGGAASAASAQAAATQARLAEQLFNQAAPLRRALFDPGQGAGPLGQRAGLIGEILQPITVEPTADLTRTLTRPASEAQFSTARENIMRTVPRGGLQQRLLADIETSRIQDLSRQETEFGIADIARREQAEETRAGRIFQAGAPALGASQIGVTGLGSAATTLGQLGQAQSARQSASKAGAGQLAGTLVGTLVGGPLAGASLGKALRG